MSEEVKPGPVRAERPVYEGKIADVWDAYLSELVGHDDRMGWAHLPATFRWYEFQDRLFDALLPATPQPAEARGIVEAQRLIDAARPFAWVANLVPKHHDAEWVEPDDGCVFQAGDFRKLAEAVAALSATLSLQVPSSDEMVAFGASDAACYLYPGEDQAKERAAFCDGASRYASPQAGGGDCADEPALCPRCHGGPCDASPPAPADNAGLVEAARAVINQASRTYKAGNGRTMSIEADDGEACWIVHSDDMAQLEGELDRLSALRANGAEREGVS